MNQACVRPTGRQGAEAYRERRLRRWLPPEAWDPDQVQETLAPSRLQESYAQDVSRGNRPRGCARWDLLGNVPHGYVVFQFFSFSVFQFFSFSVFQSTGLIFLVRVVI
jgi:hypothetical protein